MRSERTYEKRPKNDEKINIDLKYFFSVKLYTKYYRPVIKIAFEKKTKAAKKVPPFAYFQFFDYVVTFW